MTDGKQPWRNGLVDKMQSIAPGVEEGVLNEVGGVVDIAGPSQEIALQTIRMLGLHPAPRVLVSALKTEPQVSFDQKGGRDCIRGPDLHSWWVHDAPGKHAMASLQGLEPTDSVSDGRPDVDEWALDRSFYRI